jgi:putative salt-induced outer membrane protein
MLIGAFLIAAAAFAGDPQATRGAPVPPDLQDMLTAAMQSGNDSEVGTIAKYAAKAAPQSEKTINDEVIAWRDARTKAHEAKVEAADFLDLWTGKATVGGWLATGNSPSVGLSGVIDLERDGLRWRHKVHLQADYQESDHIVTREHYLASYEPNYKVDDRSYIYGSTQFESDRFLGYYDRFSESVGAGYSVLKQPDLKLDLELGPAYRYTHYTDTTSEGSIATRGSVDFKWQLTPTISITQQADAYFQHYNSTLTGTTALNAKLFGPLSAQFSYNIQYESMPPDGSLSTDTTSRASLVYSF